MPHFGILDTTSTGNINSDYNGAIGYGIGSIVYYNGILYVCINPVGAFTAQWDAAFGGAKFVVTNGGKTATTQNINQTDTIRTINHQPNGLWSWRFQVEQLGQDLLYGFGTATVTNGTAPVGIAAAVSYGTNGNRWRTNGGDILTGMPAAGLNAWCEIACDLTAGKIAIRNLTFDPATWYGNNGIANIAAETGMAAFTPFGADAYALFCSNQNGTHQIGNADFVGNALPIAPPPNFPPWAGNLTPDQDPSHWAPVSLVSGGVTQGSVIFGGSGGALAQDNANFFWDGTNHRLGIGSVLPKSSLHVASAAAVAAGYTRFVTSDYVDGSVGSGLFFQAGATSGNTYSSISALSAGFSAINSLVLQPSGGNVGVNTGATAPVFNFQAHVGSATNIGFLSGGTDIATMWAVTDNAGAYKAMRIDGLTLALNSQSSGNVGIKNPSPQTALDVGGLVKTQTYTVATLPAAVAGLQGARAAVSDALAPAFGSPVAAGGAVYTPVICTGSAWNVG